MLEMSERPFMPILNERIREILEGTRTVIPYCSSIENTEHIVQGQELVFGKPKISFGVAIQNTWNNKWLGVVPYSTIEFRCLMEGIYTRPELGFLISQLFPHELNFFAAKIYNVQEFEDHMRTTLFREPNRLFYPIYKENSACILELARKILNDRIVNPDKTKICQVGFPKGHAFQNEPTLKTAIRELLEETGITIEFPSMEEEVEPVIPLRETLPVLIHFPNNTVKKFQGRATREPVQHFHSDIRGRVYKTVLWIITVCIPPEEDMDRKISVSNLETPHEISSISWFTVEEMKAQSRVKELFEKVLSMVS